MNDYFANDEYWKKHIDEDHDDMTIDDESKEVVIDYPFPIKTENRADEVVNGFLSVDIYNSQAILVLIYIDCYFFVIVLQFICFYFSIFIIFKYCPIFTNKYIF